MPVSVPAMPEDPPGRAEGCASLSKSELSEENPHLQLGSVTFSARRNTSFPSSDVRGQSVFRSRLQNGMSATSARRAEGNRIYQDTRRYMQAAAASSQNTVHQLVNRLQTYRTFQPFLSPPTAYRSGSLAQERASSTANSLPVRRMSTAVVSVNQIWQMLDRALDTSVAQMLQHNAEGNFIMTLESALGIEATTSMEKVRTVIESRKPGTTANNGAALDPLHEERAPLRDTRQTPLSASIKSKGMHSSTSLNVFADRWIAEYGFRTAAEVEEQHSAWLGFDRERHRRGRLMYLQALKDQLDKLQEENVQDVSEAAQSPDACGDASSLRLVDTRDPIGLDGVSDTSFHSIGSRTAAAHVLRDEDAAAKAEWEKQQTLWKTFSSDAEVSQDAGKYSHERVQEAPRIVSAYLECDDLKDWLYSSWPHRTHRHESAALRIQCAYRVYCARLEVLNRRYERRQSFLAGLHAEKEARCMWDMALQVKTDPVTSVSSADAAMRAVQFFIDKVNAVVAKRRARKQYEQQQNDEMRHYAATRIQAMYRGHRARVFVMELRYPEIAAHRRRIRCDRFATLIQSFWRRYTAQRGWCRIRHAVFVLQGVYRCYLARRALAQRRHERNLVYAKELNRCAIQRIEQWYLSCRAVRAAFGSMHMTELLMLQRVCRGYQGRQHVRRQGRLIRIRRAVQIIGEHRRRFLDTRRAIEAKTALSAANEVRRTALMRDDAALTIQRAWRQSHIMGD